MIFAGGGSCGAVLLVPRNAMKIKHKKKLPTGSLTKAQAPSSTGDSAGCNVLQVEQSRVVSDLALSLPPAPVPAPALLQARWTFSTDFSTRLQEKVIEKEHIPEKELPSGLHAISKAHLQGCYKTPPLRAAQ